MIDRAEGSKFWYDEAGNLTRQDFSDGTSDAVRRTDRLTRRARAERHAQCHRWLRVTLRVVV